ncbi:MAG: helix-hairpin-helix domain-containing protein [Gemmatimonadales bacterium]|jgi:competence ComEA-like helix-hairpin-helix protein|nr:MAG: helix-hairpin-helix domain-containing protein [Gemmatimonadales bacterium]
MDAPGRRTFIQLVGVLLVTGAVRTAWHHRVTGGATLPGTGVSLDALADSAARLAAAEARRARPLAAGERLDPNRAEEEELDRLPGVGPSTARAIVSARDTLPFKSVDDLTRVRGIGERTLERLRPRLTLPSAPAAPGPAPPEAHREPRRSQRAGLLPASPRTAATSSGVVNVNRASETELQVLPGVGPVLAGRLVEYRRRNGPFRTPAELEAVSGIGPVLLERLRPWLRFR